jgi:Fur family peroxide stress response transcriptional regulator
MEIHEHKKQIAEKMFLFEQKCKEAGLRLTPQRLEIYHELVSAKDHPSAYTLHKRLHKQMPTLSLDTVYRTLLTFEQYELIGRVTTQESQARFDAETEPHHHLICSVCKEIVDVESGSLEEVPIPDEVSRWGVIKSESVVFYGICNKCLEKSNKLKSH